jgi:hypothetical protein
MNDESSPQTQAPTKNAGSTSTDPQQDQADQQVNMKMQGSTRNAQGQVGGSRPGNDASNKSAESKGADGQRAGEGRKQARSSDGAPSESHKNSAASNTNRPGPADTATSDTDADLDLNLDDEDSDKSDGHKLNKSDAAKEPTADASKSIKHSSNSIHSDSDRDDRGQNNPNKGGRKH